MRTKATLLIIAGLAPVLTACGAGNGIIGRERPDEFAVSRQAPLVVPPDFNLVPPDPGAPRPTEGTASEQALEALFGPVERSDVEEAALERAGTADPGIRSEVGDPQTNTVSKGAVTRDILAAPEGDGANSQTAIPG
ncbi:DUF3035 domain-containing protein [Qipengyuania sp. JC766]|uniref:DUF3035 domain-containing protein n=1 Tax=Qipengyuania sp. JC766 TaxID=3232139 RepID=UPI0034580553